MTQKISLLDAVPHSVGDIEEAAMLHVYNQSWQPYTSACDLRPVSSQSEIRRLDYVSLRNPAKEAERKSDLWQMLRYSAEFHHLIATKTEQLIPLPYWNLIFWKNFPVFNYPIDGQDYTYMTATENLMVEKPALALAQPISAGTVLKIHTNWPFENLQKAFGELVQQGWLNSGAELLVSKRFVRFVTTEPVHPTTAYFEWLSSQSRLRCVTDVLDLRKSILHQHFLHKGKPLNEKALQRGLKVTEYDYFDVIADILQPYLPN